MNNRITMFYSLTVTFVLALCASSGEVVSSARSASLSVDTVSIANSMFTVDGSMLPFRLDYSPSMWNDVNGESGSVRITANDETILEATQNGTFQWTPSIAGLYSIKHIAANGTIISKQFKVVCPEVTIEREGYNHCKLTASDGMSEIRYTTDGTVPTAASTLYTGPFEVLPSRLSLVHAATFAVGCPQGEVASAHFNPVASLVSVAQANCAIDNSGEVKQIGYDAIPLPYDTTWEGDTNSSVELRVDGELIAERSGAGDVAWTPKHEGLTVLTLRTVNASGGMLAEYSAQYDVVPRTVTITNGTDEIAPLNELYPGLCHWITNIVIETGVTNLGKQVEFDSGNWLSVDASDTDRLLAYRSNVISHNDRTEMSMTVEGPLDWLFKWKVSSEGNYDWLRWSLDGVEKTKISGTGSGWQEVLCSIPDGEHVVRWAYTKDGSANSGDDCGWVAFDLPMNSSAIFEGCNGLTSVTMPWKLLKQMRSIVPASFDKLETITLTGEPTEVPAHAFEGCAALRSIEIPSSVTKIGASAFAGCSNLTEVVIPGSVWDVGEGAFANCTGLKRVEVAKVLLLQIESRGVFDGCAEDLEIVYVAPEIRNVAAKQRYPWNGKVDVSFEVAGDVMAGRPPDGPSTLILSATDRATGSNYVAVTFALSGDTGTVEGAHDVVWDLNAQGLELTSDDVVFTVAYETCSADTTPVTIDSRTETVVDSVVVPWDATWVGGAVDATVVIADNGTEIRRTTGVGEFSYVPTGIGRHELTYTTYIDGVAQDEVYAATVYKDWKYEVRDGGAVIVDTVHKADGVAVPLEIDGYPVVGELSETEISFGDTYRYHISDWDNGGYVERDLKKSNYVRVFTDGTDNHTHVALFEVLGASSKEMIKPVVENFGFKGTLTASVWTDEELRNAVLPPLSTAGEWELEGCSIDNRDPDDISGPCNSSYYPDSVYEYESDNGEFNWPKDLWPDNKTVAGRFWVSVACKASEVGRWGGIDGGFRVWQSGTGVKSEQMYVTCKTEGSWPCSTNLPSLFRGLPLTNSDRYGFDIDIWDVIHIAYGVPLHGFWLDAAPERPGAPLEITLPEAGILYMTAYEGDLEGIDVENADSVERKSVSWDQYAAMGGEQYFYEYSADYNNRSVLAAKVNSGRTIRLVQEDEFEDYDFNRFQFFPSSSKAVAVEASFVSIFDKNRYPRQSGDNVGDYLQGYVAGTGVYKVGETVSVTAVPAPGEAFDHWELKYGNFPAGIDTNNTVLSFTVTDACAGTAEERKQMVVRAVWKEKKQVIATSSNIARGHVTGSGFYHNGDLVTLTAVPEKGYEFAGWSDGVVDAVRTVTVSDGDQLFCAHFVVSQNCRIEDVLDGIWTSGVYGGGWVTGRVDQTVNDGVSVKFMAADESAAWVETVVTNSCRVSFDWKCSCEGLIKNKPYDYISFSIDGVRQDFICGETDWTNTTFYVTGAGEHRLRWTFQRDEDGSSGEDSAWLANVSIVPSVAVTFATGGATAGMPPEPITAYADESIVLPELGSLAWPKHTFLGWSDGDTLYAAGAVYPCNDALLLTAQWAENTLSAPVISAPSTYEADSCTVTITADAGASIYYTLDGSEPNSARPEASPYLGPFTVEGSAIVRAIAVRDDYFDSEVAQFEVARMTWTFGEYLNWPEQTFTTGGAASWTRVKGVSEDGYALRSGIITHSQTSRLETVISGAGTISFACRIEGEIVKKTVYDGLAFCIDGIQQGDLMGNTVWATNTFEVTGDGSHTLSWLYVKDEEGDGGGADCAWVDAVTWTPAGGNTDTVVDVGGGKSVTVPGAWLTEKTTRAATDVAANGRKVWECYVLGLNPEDSSVTNDFRITSFPMKADGTPDIEHIVFDPPQTRWSVPATYKVKGAVKLSDTDWPEVTEGNKANFRFFKIELVLP